LALRGRLMDIFIPVFKFCTATLDYYVK